MNYRRSTRQAARPAVGISLTCVTSSESGHDNLLLRFVRATQILMIGAERRRAAESEAGNDNAKRSAFQSEDYSVRRLPTLFQ